jgi:hypothetical protein
MLHDLMESSELEAALRENDRTEQIDSKLEITLICISLKSARAAMNTAVSLAVRVGARITIVAAQVVPYPLPLTRPPVSLEFQESCFRELVSGSPVEASVQFYLCRDEIETLKKVLKPHSMVIIGTNKRGWATRAKHLARMLRCEGHDVFLAHGE